MINSLHKEAAGLNCYGPSEKIRRGSRMVYYFKRCFLLLAGFIAVLSAGAQPKTTTMLQNILSRNPDALFQKLLHHPEEYRLQIIYTQINRDADNRPHFSNYYYHADSLLYFNPASTVKLPLALLALEKLNKMHIPGVNKYTPMLTDSAFAGQTKVESDSTAADGLPSIAQYIRKVFLVSDNEAYNRLYEFIGQQTINETLHRKGYPDVRITRRFTPMTAEENRHTNPVRFVRKNGSLIYGQPPAYNPDPFDFSHVVKIGKGHWNAQDSLINEPMDFTTANNISLEDLQQLLQSALFPGSVPAGRRFDLTKEDYRFLHRYMSQYPSETNYPKYDSSEYYDSYVKFFFRQGSHHIPSYIRVFNKPGWSYGFLTDVSYVVDFKHKVEFMLSATVYVNSDGILNDNKYDYDTVGYPFLYQLGQTVYQYELSRERKYTPDLKEFKIRYERRDPDDKRPEIKEIDN